MELPQEFINILPCSERDALLAALATEPEVSIRFNSKSAQSQNLVLESLECRADGRVSWMDQAVYLDHRPQFTMDPLIHQGCYYVQEASSMFLAQAVSKCVSGPVRALDLCAAPGGKSTLLAQLLPEGSLLISNEIQRGRAQILAENMVKWGRPGVMVTCNTPLLRWMHPARARVCSERMRGPFATGASRTLRCVLPASARLSMTYGLH